MPVQQSGFTSRSQRPRRPERKSLLPTRPLRLSWLMWSLGIAGLMAAAFVTGWLTALGPVSQALAQLHRDIRAVQAHRPLVLHPLNVWSGLGGFVLGMLVMAMGNHWLRPSPRPSMWAPASSDQATPDDGGVEPSPDTYAPDSAE